MYWHEQDVCHIRMSRSMIPYRHIFMEWNGMDMDRGSSISINIIFVSSELEQKEFFFHLHSFRIECTWCLQEKHSKKNAIDEFYWTPKPLITIHFEKNSHVFYRFFFKKISQAFSPHILLRIIKFTYRAYCTLMLERIEGQSYLKIGKKIHSLIKSECLKKIQEKNIGKWFHQGLLSFKM